MKRMNVRKARELRSGMTDAEQLLWYHLRGRRLSGWKFRRQHEIDRYIVDFVCADADLIVELDGGQHAEQVEEDAYRTQRLEKLGFRVLRFWNGDVLTNTEAVLEVILKAAASVAPHPNPLPGGERE
jgi:very-short-patch-repair endonuclease